MNITWLYRSLGLIISTFETLFTTSFHLFPSNFVRPVITNKRRLSHTRKKALVNLGFFFSVKSLCFFFFSLIFGNSKLQKFFLFQAHLYMCLYGCGDVFKDEVLEAIMKYGMRFYCDQTMDLLSRFCEQTMFLGGWLYKRIHKNHSLSNTQSKLRIFLVSYKDNSL